MVIYSDNSVYELKLIRDTEAKIFIDNFKRNRPPTASLTQFLPFAAAFMALVDGEIHESEIRKIHEIGKKFLGKKFSKKQLDQAFEEISQLLTDADDIVFNKWEALTIDTFSKMNLSSEGEKQALLAFFCELAFADGSVHKKEAEFVEKLSDAINFQNPFELVADDRPDKKISKTPGWHLKSSEAFGMLAKMLSDGIIQAGLVSKKRRHECLAIASEIVLANKEKSAALLDGDDVFRRDVFLNFSKQILSKL